MFELIYSEQNEVEQLEIDTVAQNPAFLRFLRIERTEIERTLMSLEITPDSPNDFMLKHAIVQSRKGCIDDLLNFLEERREALIERREQTTAN